MAAVDARAPRRVALASTVELVIQVTPELGAELASPGDRPSDAARAILDRLRDAGTEPVPQGGPPEFFSADVPDQATGEAIVADLQGLEGVVAAYVKPDIRPPS
jgi:hypothetical protein